MARYDVSQIKSLAIGRWPELLGLDNEILDNNHHPCPKCGGRDRFRALDDFYSSGGLICNKCFNRGNGDGISAYAWLHDCTLGEAIKQLANELGVDPEPNSALANQGGKHRSVKKRVKKQHDSVPDKKPKRSLAESFKFQPWNESLAGIFCLRKGGIVTPSLVAIGAQLATHAGIVVLTLPIKNESKQVVGYTAANVTGGKIAIAGEGPDSPSDFTSWKNKIQHKAKGIIATPNLFSAELRPSITRVYKTEGPSDLLSLIPLLNLETEAAFCNPCGANENPENYPWLAEWLAGKQVIVIHDRDSAGVSGSMGDPTRNRLGWATWAAMFADDTRAIELPYPLVESHGKDLRDWIRDGGNRHGLEILISESKHVDRSGIKVLEDGADPHYLARINLQNYQEKHGRRLVFWKNEWFRWKAGCYVRMDASELRSKVSAAVRKEFESQWRDEFERYKEWQASDDWTKEKDKGPPLIKKVTPQLVTAVISAMASIVQLPGTVPMPCWLEDRSERHYVSMQNGILDFDKVFAGSEVEDFLLPHSSNWFSQFQLGYRFDFESKCPTWFDYLNYSMEGDQERIDLLQEWAGYLLTTTNYLQKFIVLEGKGGNGKTVYFAVIRAMLGNENVSSVALENFGGRFDLATTIGKAANICGDVGEVDSVAEGALKQFTGGDAMTFDRKGTTPLEMIPTAKLMCAWNLRPRFKDRSSGVWRRMILVPFEREVEDTRRITGMDSYKFWLTSGEVPAILRWAIEGLDRLRTMGRFTRSKVCDKAAAEYRLESNPANDFLAENVKAEPDDEISCKWLYELYSAWCKQFGHTYPLSNSQFGKEVKKAFPGVERKLMRNRVEVAKEDRDRQWFYSGITFSVNSIAGKNVWEII